MDNEMFLHCKSCGSDKLVVFIKDRKLCAGCPQCEKLVLATDSLEPLFEMANNKGDKEKK